MTWLGHSTVLLELGGLTIVADPLLRHRVGLLRHADDAPPQRRRLLATGVDVVLLSHLHHDHCDLPSLRRLASPLVVAPPGSAAWLTRRDVPGVVELGPGESADVGAGVVVHAVTAHHSGRREPFGPGAVAVGHLVEAAGVSAWLVGDTGLFPGMRSLRDRTRAGRIDVAAVPVWGWGPSLGPGHLDPLHAAEAVRRAGVHDAVPVHWGTLHPAGMRRVMTAHLATPGARFARALAEPGDGPGAGPGAHGPRSHGPRAHVLQPGDALELPVPRS
ncbi:MBL fold metallo-hydrolase [uncultured Cellulomonas sp.]|uniref:MBL fold metallo-hydrolase n=1 Tax=uncultured Cellulomonas sp. TaxID=189682 RepID=UPI002631935B|nr:MBL fold metallo-hydrolase [uncultured Cellulomonas sp.]